MLFSAMLFMILFSFSAISLTSPASIPISSFVDIEDRAVKSPAATWAKVSKTIFKGFAMELAINIPISPMNKVAAKVMMDMRTIDER